MATNSAKQANTSVGLIELSINHKGAVEHYIRERDEKKWVYVISETIRWTDKSTPVVQLSSRSNSTKLAWVEKILKCGQSRLIVTENLELHPIESLRLKKQCAQLGVIMVNLTVDSKNANVINGPW